MKYSYSREEKEVWKSSISFPGYADWYSYSLRIKHVDTGSEHSGQNICSPQVKFSLPLSDKGWCPGICEALGFLLLECLISSSFPQTSMLGDFAFPSSGVIENLIRIKPERMVFFPKVTRGKLFKPLTAHQPEMRVLSFSDELPPGNKQSCLPSSTDSAPGGRSSKRPTGTIPHLISTVIPKVPMV